MSSRESVVDVGIIGGGPAGAGAARLLALWGHSVTLVGRAAPHPSVAESLPPSSFKLLQQIGVREAVEAAGFPRSTGNSVLWDDGESLRPESFPGDGHGVQVRRDLLDRLLLAEAARAGVTIRRGSVRGVARDVAQGTSRVRYDTTRGEATLSSRWVLDCSGRTCLTSRRDRGPNDTPRTLALIATWERPAWPLLDASHTLVESYLDGWAWSVPLSTRRRQLAVMVDPPRVRARAPLTAWYHAELAKTAWLCGLVGDARRVREPWARDASAYIVSTVAEEGVLRVGDAASFVDPLSSYGVKKALAS